MKKMAMKVELKKSVFQTFCSYSDIFSNSTLWLYFFVVKIQFSLSNLFVNDLFQFVKTIV